jgi:glycine/serine hydroxymethyltransferase
MKEEEMKTIAKLINEVVDWTTQTKRRLKLNEEDEKNKENRRKIITQTPQLKQIKQSVLTLCKKFPLKEIY